MKYLLYILFTFLPLLSFGRVNFAVGVYYCNDSVYPMYLKFRFHNDAVMRRALLKTNGKEWFIKHVVKAEPDSLSFKLKFIAGDYCIAGEADPQKNGTKDEFFAGLKKAVNYMSANNDTVFYFLQYLRDYEKIDEYFKNVWIGIRRAWGSDSIEYKYDYNNFFRYHPTAQAIDCFPISFGYMFVPRDCLDVKFHEDIDFSPIFPDGLDKEFINKFCYTHFNKDNCNLTYPPLTSDEDAEELFEKIKYFDDYILSLPPFPESQVKVFPWGYDARTHNDDNPYTYDFTAF